jgi:predicted Mrr-cat superfamily restriction endonuclease
MWQSCANHVPLGCSSKKSAAIGWEQMGDLSPLRTRADFKRRYEEVYPDVKPAAIPVSAGQLSLRRSTSQRR